MQIEFLLTISLAMNLIQLVRAWRKGKSLKFYKQRSDRQSEYINGLTHTFDEMYKNFTEDNLNGK